MGKIHIVSNRLPFSITEVENEIQLTPSVGGLATGMKSIYKEYGGSWIGWSGIATDEYDKTVLREVDSALRKENCVPVSLDADEISLFYEGFSNDAIWPLFHYFAQFADFAPEYWEAYRAANQKFADAALETIEEGDSVWIHDYQLLLVPEMIKSKKPNVTVGFFLHIPFPSFELFRTIPWRKEILQGMLGADLVGFHIFPYQRHFFSCVRRIFGYEISFNQIHVEDRVVLADAFPMGIDYDKFHEAALDVRQRVTQEKSEFHQELEKYLLMDSEHRLILSIDRLDYTKGIANRLKAFARFLKAHPEMKNKVSLIMLAVPSRSEVEQYQLLKREVDELVGSINGEFGGINYTPIWYFYRSLPFESLIELYSLCDVALITPVRDGMNLVAKEYVACRTSNTGVMILSEMAGVSQEMGEAIIINPNDEEVMASAIHQALTMPIEEQRERMTYLQKRVRRYNVFKWARDFVDSMGKAEQVQGEFLAKKITGVLRRNLLGQYREGENRALFLDYDGTLAHFHKNPQAAYPDTQLHDILYQLEADSANTVTLISGRDRETLERWMKGHKVNLICEHGVWMKRYGGEWEMLASASNSWMPMVRPVLEFFVDRTPGAFIEEKNYSLVWHYRKAEPEQGDLRANELKAELTNLVSNHNLEIMEGNKVIEVKSGGINKGIAALGFIKNDDYDFIMAIGDDWTDEYMFRELPSEAITIKVGIKHTSADYNLESVRAVRGFLTDMGKVSEGGKGKK